MQALYSLDREGVLIVAKRDRLGRDAGELALVERDLGKRKSRVVSAAGEGTENNDPDSLFMRRIIDALAERELSLIKFRSKVALREKRARGEVAGKPPFGSKVGQDGKKLVMDMDEQKVIGRVRELHARGMSQRKIVDKLRIDGVVGRTGQPLGRTQVRRIIHGKR